jgi:hypothetical protein
MSERDGEVLKLYREQRVRSQVEEFYGPRSGEYRSANRQSLVVKAVLLALGGVAGVLAGANVGGLRSLWSVLAAAFPALSTALVAYDGLFSFERLAKLYSDVIAATNLVEEPTGLAVDAASVAAYVTTVEAIFQREQGQWGQLTGEIELAAPPKPN